MTKKRTCSTDSIILSFTLFFFLLESAVGFFALVVVFFLLFVGSAASNTVIGSSVSNAIQKSNKISLTKNIALHEKNIDTTIVATKFENGVGKNSCAVWPDNSYFKQQPCDFHLDKENIPENSIFYINQG